MTFEQYLQEQLDKDGSPASYYKELKDFMMNNAYFVKQIYGWHKQEMKSIRAKGANTTNSKYSKEQRSEWARKGGLKRVENFNKSKI
jgi:hypothetical protein